MPGYLSRYRGVSPVGTMLAMPARAALLTLGDGSKWLRSGYLALAASYPTAAALQHMRAHSFSATATVLGSNGLSLATNGTGTWVIVRASASTISYSTDNGQTWSTAAHGMAANPTKVVWAGARFVAVGNDSTLLAAGTSTDGITWANNVIANPGSGLTANTAVVAWNGSVVIAAVQGGDAYTSTTGTGSWTARTAGFSGQPLIDANAFQTVIFQAAGSTAARRSADGITWSALTLPTANAVSSGPMLLADRLAYLTAVSGVTGIRTTANFTTFSGLFIPPTPISGAQIEQKFRSGSRIGLAAGSASAAQILFTSDGEVWEAHSTSDASGQYAYGEGNGRMVAMPLGTTTPILYAQSNLDASNAVGISAVVGTGAAVSATQATFYARIQ